MFAWLMLGFGGAVFWIMSSEDDLRKAKKQIALLEEENKHLRQQLGLPPHRREAE